MASSFKDFSQTESAKKSTGADARSSARSSAGAKSSAGTSRTASAPRGNAGSRSASGRTSATKASKPGFDYNIPTVSENAAAHRAARTQAAAQSTPRTQSVRTQSTGQSAGHSAHTTAYATSVSRSAAAKKRKKKQQRAVAFGLVFLLALLGITVFVVVRSVSDPVPTVIELDPANDVYKSGVTINGINVSGLTLDQAREAVKPSIDNIVQSIAVPIRGDDFTATITAGQLNVQSDLETILNNAFTGNADETYTTSFTFDREALSLAIRDMNAMLSHGATDATFTLDVDSKGKPELKFIEGKPGMGFDIDGTAELIMNELEAGHFTAEIKPALTMIEPTISVDDLKKQITQIGTYSTTYCAELPSDQPEEDRMVIENRSFNIAKASGIINGKIIQPGASFSFNKTVGNRNEKNGWRQAKGIYGGETYNMQYGGGVCQVSTTLYVALIRAGIPFSAITRQNHSIPSTYVPKGLDATVDSGHIDFKFKNTTNSPIYIFAYSTVNKKRSRYRDLTVSIYGAALEEGLSYDLRSVNIEELEPGEPIISYNKKETVDFNQVTVEARTGYVVDVYRDTYMNGKVVSSEKLYEDRYEAVTEKRIVGTQPTPTPTAGVPIEPVTVE